MNDLTTFFVDKTNQTFSDELVAFGWMRVLTDLHERQQTPSGVMLRDDGMYYRITCASPVQTETIEGLRDQPIWFGDAPVIATVKNTDKLPSDVPRRVSYEHERERVNLYYAAREKAQDKNSQLPEVHQHWDIFRAINPAALPGYNGLLVDFWKARTALPEIIELLMRLFSQTPNDVEGAALAWKQIDSHYGYKIGAWTTCQQIYNPEQGKGQNRGKANGLSIGNLDGFWLLEWLKLIGFYEAALTRQVRGAKDRKTFVVVPRELTFAENSVILKRFSATMQYAETSTKFDILAAIRYLQTALDYFNEQPERRNRLLDARNVKKKLVGGFHTAFYKDLGNAVATMNASFIALPGWVEITSPDDVRVFKEMLGELEKLVRQFDESHSDAFNLLQDLRDFVSGDDLTAFFRFTNAFPSYYMGKREQGKYAYALSTEFIERLIMSTEQPLSEILESPGFQNIAYVIRQSTVTAQYRKKQGERKYDVRYGLGQELARKARYKDEFIAALSDFLFKYNAENAQVMETRSGPYRRSVKTTDIDEIVQLIDRFGSQTVANLLIAYGYARVPHDDIDESTDTQEEIAS